MSTSAAEREAPGTIARRIMRTTDRATLATLLPKDGGPYASLVLVALDHDAAPLLYVSTLAEHTKNLSADDRVSLLFDGTVGLDEPLTGARVSVVGRIARTDDARLAARFVARHPGAAAYTGFSDFACYRVAVARAHLVAGFGQIHWIHAPDLLFDTRGCEALAAAEPEILAHMNADHQAALDLYATRLAGQAGEGWRATGVDPEGLDLRRGGAVARVAFAGPVGTAEAARTELVRLAHAARAAAPAP